MTAFNSFTIKSLLFSPLCTIALGTSILSSLLGSISSLHAMSVQNTNEHASEEPAQTKTQAILTLPFDPGTVDPRKIRDLSQVAISRCLFSGLLRADKNNQPIPNIASSIVDLDNGTVYTCTIHPDAKWSDGTPITSKDVKSTWLSTLTAKEGSPNASMLFIIKNAEKFYRGEATEEQVGIEADDDQTITITLENRCPFFPQLLTTYPFFILPKGWIDAEKNLSTVITMKGAESAPSYGPYILDRWNSNKSLVLRKNPQYRWANKVLYDEVVFEIVNDETALIMFENGEVDLVGSPLGTLPTDAIPELKARGVIGTAPAFTTTFLRVNTRHAALSNPEIRSTLSQSIDRKSLVQYVIHGAGVEATHLVPPQFTRIPSNAIQQAEATKKTSLKHTTLRLSYPANERASKIAQAIQQNIQEKNPNLVIQLDPSDAKHLYARIKQGNYDLALGSWVGDYLDPNSFYSVFETKDCGTNNTGWESSEYRHWLVQSREVNDGAKREQAFAEMENILQKECPVIPLFHNVYMFARSEKVKQLYVSPMGTFDFLD